MKVFIVMIESIYSSHTQWDIDRTFSTMQAAKDYIAMRKVGYKSYYDVPEFDIEVEEVLE